MLELPTELTGFRVGQARSWTDRIPAIPGGDQAPPQNIWGEDSAALQRLVLPQATLDEVVRDPDGLVLLANLVNRAAKVDDPAWYDVKSSLVLWALQVHPHCWCTIEELDDQTDEQVAYFETPYGQVSFHLPDVGRSAIQGYILEDPPAWSQEYLQSQAEDIFRAWAEERFLAPTTPTPTPTPNPTPAEVARQAAAYRGKRRRGSDEYASFPGELQAEIDRQNDVASKRLCWRPPSEKTLPYWWKCKYMEGGRLVRLMRELSRDRRLRWADAWWELEQKVASRPSRWWEPRRADHDGRLEERAARLVLRRTGTANFMALCQRMAERASILEIREVGLLPLQEIPTMEDLLDQRAERQARRRAAEAEANRVAEPENRAKLLEFDEEEDLR